MWRRTFDDRQPRSSICVRVASEDREILAMGFFSEFLCFHHRSSPLLKQPPPPPPLNFPLLPFKFISKTSPQFFSRQAYSHLTLEEWQIPASNRMAGWQMEDWIAFVSLGLQPGVKDLQHSAGRLGCTTHTRLTKRFSPRRVPVFLRMLSGLLDLTRHDCVLYSKKKERNASRIDCEDTT